MRFDARAALACCLWACGCTGSGPRPNEVAAPLASDIPTLPPSPALDRCLAETAAQAAKPGDPGPAVAAGCAQIAFENRMGSTFRLQSISVYIDDMLMLERIDPSDGPGSLSRVRDLPVFIGPVAAGDHEIRVDLVYVSHGLGIFSYAHDYTFRVRSTQAITVRAGRPSRLQIVAYEKGNLLTPIEERPAVRFALESGG